MAPVLRAQEAPGRQQRPPHSHPHPGQRTMLQQPRYQPPQVGCERVWMRGRQTLSTLRWEPGCTAAPWAVHPGGPGSKLRECSTVAHVSLVHKHCCQATSTLDVHQDAPPHLMFTKTHPPHLFQHFVCLLHPVQRPHLSIHMEPTANHLNRQLFCLRIHHPPPEGRLGIRELPPAPLLRHGGEADLMGVGGVKGGR